MFSQAELDYFFAGNNMPQDQADGCFLERYCSRDRQGQAGGLLTGTASRIAGGGISVSTARRVIREIAVHTPSGSHTTPTYSWPAGLDPLITVGTMRKNGRINGARYHFGLIIIDGRIRIWVHERALERVFGNIPAGWETLPVGAANAPVRLSGPLHNAQGQIDPCMANPNSAERLFLRNTELDIANRNVPAALQAALLRCRHALGEPWILQNSPPWTVVYPRLLTNRCD